MSNCTRIPGQISTCGQLRSMQIEMVGFGPNLLPDDSASGALRAKTWQGHDNMEPGPDRQAIARLFAGAPRLQFDNLERLLAEGSKPNFS